MGKDKTPHGENKTLHDEKASAAWRKQNAAWRKGKRYMMESQPWGSSWQWPLIETPARFRLRQNMEYGIFFAVSPEWAGGLGWWNRQITRAGEWRATVVATALGLRQRKV